MPLKVTVSISPPAPAGAWNALSDSLKLYGASPMSCLAFIDDIEVSAVTELDRCSLDGQLGLENGRLPAADMRFRLACPSPAIGPVCRSSAAFP